MNPLDGIDLDQLRARTSAKWRTYPPDVLPLWVAELDVQLAPPVADVLHNAITEGDTGYASGPIDYAAAVQEFALTRWGWACTLVGRSALVADVMTGIVDVLRLISEPGDPVVVCSPVYPPFYAFVTHAGRQVIEAPLDSDHRLDPVAIEAAFRAAADISSRPTLLLCNPHNPTGTVHTRAELEVVATLARRYGVRVVSDEIHSPLVLRGASFVPYLSVEGSETAFALYSASKGWNLAGLKAALLVAGEGATNDLMRLPEEVGHGPSHLGVLAHTAAWRDGGEWLDALLEGLDMNRSLLVDLIVEHLPQTTLVVPEATYLAWLDCRGLGLDDDEPSGGDGLGTVSDLAGPAKAFLDRARVALSSGHVFGTGGRGHVRINFGTSPTILREAVARMGSITHG